MSAAARALGALRRALVRVVNALPDLSLGVACFAAWQSPDAWSEARTAMLARLVMMEFAAIHCSGFMFVVWLTDWRIAKRAAYLAALTGAYSLVLGVIALTLGDAWPLAVFWGLIANRALVMLRDDAEDAAHRKTVLHAWAGTTALYALLGSIAVMHSGAFDTSAFLAAGALYYTAVGLSELGAWWWVGRWLDRAPSRS